MTRRELLATASLAARARGDHAEEARLDAEIAALDAWNDAVVFAPADDETPVLAGVGS